jgi:hypothetical protein
VKEDDDRVIASKKVFLDCLGKGARNIHQSPMEAQPSPPPPPPPPRAVLWRAVAEAPDLAGVAGPRVRFLCLDASAKHVVLGANTGSVYVFARTTVAPSSGTSTSSTRGGAAAARGAASGAAAATAAAAAAAAAAAVAPSPFGDEGGAPEGPLRFLTVVSPADAPHRGVGGVTSVSSSVSSAGAGAGGGSGGGGRARSVSPAISRLKLNPLGTLCAIAYTNGILHVIAFALGAERRNSPGKVGKCLQTVLPIK